MLPGILGNTAANAVRASAVPADITYQESAEASGTSTVSLSATIPADCKFIVVFHHLHDDDNTSFTSDVCTIGGVSATGLTARNGTSGSKMAMVRAWYQATPLTGAQTITCEYSGGGTLDRSSLTAVYIAKTVTYVAEDGDTFSSGTSCDTDIATAEALLLINGFTKDVNEATTLAGGGTELSDTSGAVSQYGAAYLIQDIPGTSAFNRSFATSSYSASATVALRAS